MALPRTTLTVLATVLTLAACGTTTNTGADEPTATDDDRLDAGWAEGVTDAEVRIGMDYLATGSGSATDEPDPAEHPKTLIYQAVVDDINEAGGAGGRELVLVWHRFQADAASPDTEWQAECSDFTTDRPVFIVGNGGHQIVRDCFGTKGVPQVDAQLGIVGETTFAADPYLVSVPGLAATRLLRTQVQVLHDQGFFQPGATIGFVMYDTPGYAEAEHEGLRPALAEYGLELAETVKVTKPEGADGVADTIAQIDGAVLKFRDKGVDHVLFLGPAPQFMVSAEQQKYRPRYGVASDVVWAATLADSGVVPAQLRNVAGVGWAPAKDVADYKAALDSPAHTACLDVLAARDIIPKTGEDEAAALDICDQLYLIKAALDAAAEPLTGDSFMAAVDQLGDAFEPAATWAAEYGPQRHDGAAAVRYFAWDQGCECFAYQSDTVPAS